ncbi:hypothetical protein BDZ85DRAFT_252779 [Elsinoe ampelina]|uniref:F-box domain-containing protein n=1 Tax=Elsinoe ampelina TaxID=302913 RepID=A0A6A6G1G8_9PEZI|nr:hypothetical protein BDZ85DRAFT_252779 [Elsinoe ampelina]
MDAGPANERTTTTSMLSTQDREVAHVDERHFHFTKAMKIAESPYLVEMIPPHLDMRTTLLSASLVCKDWKAIIDRSARVKKTLFLQPDLRHRHITCRTCPDGPTDSFMYACACNVIEDINPTAGTARLLHPLLMTKDFKQGPIVKIKLNGILLDRLSKLPADPNSSQLGKMLICQPPLTNLHISDTYSGKRVEISIADHGPGISFGVLFKAIQPYVRDLRSTASSRTILRLSAKCEEQELFLGTSYSSFAAVDGEETHDVQYLVKRRPDSLDDTDLALLGYLA